MVATFDFILFLLPKMVSVVVVGCVFNEYEVLSQNNEGAQIGSREVQKVVGLGRERLNRPLLELRT